MAPGSGWAAGWLCSLLGTVMIKLRKLGLKVLPHSASESLVIVLIYRRETRGTAEWGQRQGGH